MNLTVARDKRENLGAVIMEFFEGDKVAMSMISLTSPEMGQMIGPTGQVLHYPDIQLAFDKLQEVVSSGKEFKDIEKVQLRWIPGFRLGKDDVSTALYLSSYKTMPWVGASSELADRTSVREDGEDTIFLTPDGISYRINSKSGLLAEQTFVDNPERMVSLTDFKLNPASEEIEKIITQHQPQDAKVESFAQSPMFMQMNLTFASILVAAVDSGKVTPAQFQGFLVKARPALGEYLTLALPNSHSLILPEERWEKVFDTLQVATREQFDQQDADKPIEPDWKASKPRFC